MSVAHLRFVAEHTRNDVEYPRGDEVPVLVQEGSDRNVPAPPVLVQEGSDRNVPAPPVPVQLVTLREWHALCSFALSYDWM